MSGIDELLDAMVEIHAFEQLEILRIAFVPATLKIAFFLAILKLAFVLEILKGVVLEENHGVLEVNFDGELDYGFYEEENVLGFGGLFATENDLYVVESDEN